MWPKIAYKVIDNGLARVNMSPSEGQLCFAIWHKTYSKGRNMGKISVEHFAEMTGIKRRKVRKTLERLEERRVIRRERGCVGFNPNCREWVRKASDRKRRYQP